MRPQDDLNCSLSKLNSACHMDIISQMVDLQAHRLSNEKSTEWYKNTNYLALHPMNQRYGTTTAKNQRQLLLRRQRDDAGPVHCLSVSYTWHKSKFEGPIRYDSWIFDEAQAGRIKSKVRTSIVSRVVGYAKGYNLPGIWIDRDCINQEDSEEKSTAVQSMDLIYRFGNHPVAFLSTPIHTARQLRLLSKLIRGTWLWPPVSVADVRLKGYIRVWEAQNMISMLEYILSDPWWSRAWTYHEESCASTRMSLLIPYHKQMSTLQQRLFGGLPGEIRINAVSFRKQATRFCLAHARKCGVRWQDGNRRCKAILPKITSHRVVELYEAKHNPGHRTQDTGVDLAYCSGSVEEEVERYLGTPPDNCKLLRLFGAIGFEPREGRTPQLERCYPCIDDPKW